MIGDTASISLLTGLPGSGKSLRMVQRIADLVEQGQHVFTTNINGINVPGITPWADPTDWRSLPAGAVLFVDEAQQYFRARRGGDPPEYISAMETIRHSGVRLVLATQQPNYLDTHLRGLVGFHEHLLRQSGKEKTFIFRNHQVMDEVRQGLKRIKSLYDHEMWTLPAKYFQYYKSAEIHTVKYRMPALLKKALIIAPIALVLFALPFGYMAYTGLKKKDEAAGLKEAAAAAPPTDPAGRPSRNAGGRSESRSAEEYVQAITPLVADVAWSAPGYSGREFRSDPHIFCMSTENSCRCVTEQNTRPVVAVRDDVCRDIARWGESYNPFKDPQMARQGDARPMPDQREGEGKHGYVTQPQASAAVQGVAVQRGDRAMGSFPESPAYQSSSYMTTPPIPTRL